MTLFFFSKAFIELYFISQFQAWCLEQPKLCYRLEHIQLKLGGKRLEGGVGKEWRSDVGMNQKLGITV